MSIRRCTQTNVRTCDIRRLNGQTQVVLQYGELKHIETQTPSTKSHLVLFNWSTEGHKCLGLKYNSVISWIVNPIDRGTPQV